MCAVPDLAQQLLVGHHFAGMLHQRSQHFIFLARQSDFIAFHRHHPTGEIDR